MSTWLSIYYYNNISQDDLFGKLCTLLEATRISDVQSDWVIVTSAKQLDLALYQIRLSFPSEYKTEVCTSEFGLNINCCIDIERISNLRYDEAMADIAKIVKWVFLELERPAILVFEADFVWILRNADGFWYDPANCHSAISEVVKDVALPKSLPVFP